MNDEHDHGEHDPGEHDPDDGYDDWHEPIPDLDTPDDPVRPRPRGKRERRRGRGQRKQRPRLPDKYRTHAEFVTDWLAPSIDRRLSGARGATWCAWWWRHREVSMRLYALWRAWESARTGDDTAMSIWWVAHADAHLRVILDGEGGPMHRCRDGRHVDPPTLPVVPVPDHWFGNGLDPDPVTRRRCAYLPGPPPARDADGNPARAEVFASFVEWVEVWLAPSIARKLPGHGKGPTWCAQWWRHREAAIRLHALWRAWEAAVDDGGAAVSLWWTHGLDPHLRVLLDGTAGPLYRCSTAGHHPAAQLATRPVAAGWFIRPLVTGDVRRDPFGGFGPDFRLAAVRAWHEHPHNRSRDGVGGWCCADLTRGAGAPPAPNRPPDRPGP